MIGFQLPGGPTGVARGGAAMTRLREVIGYDGCGTVERKAFVIKPAPLPAPDQRDDCCSDCRDGWPGDCGERPEPDDERRSGASTDGPTVSGESP